VRTVDSQMVRNREKNHLEWVDLAAQPSRRGPLENIRNFFRQIDLAGVIAGSEQRFAIVPFQKKWP